MFFGFSNQPKRRGPPVVKNKMQPMNFFGEIKRGPSTFGTPGFNRRKRGSISFGDWDRDGVPNRKDCRPMNFKMHAELFHVTTEEKVPKIKKEGIKYQKKPTFIGTYGQDLRDDETVYAFKEKSDARKWAMKTEFDTQKKPVVVTFVEPDESGRIKRDINPQMQMVGKGSAVKIKGKVEPNQINAIEDFDEKMQQEMMQDTIREREELENKEIVIQMEED